MTVKALAFLIATVANKATKDIGRDWFRYLRDSWPILVVLGTSLLFLGGRLEDDSQKTQRIRREVSPTEERARRNENGIRDIQERLRLHRDEDGHKTMIERVRALERRVQQLESSE